jgi:hypothetical protein
MHNGSTPADAGVMNRVHEGMHVIDAAGEDIGRVEMVQMGDPQAATTAGNEDRPAAGPIEQVARVFGDEREPDVPEPLRSRMVRSGYLKVDGPGLLDTDRYVPASKVRSVADDRVMLSVRKEVIAKED